MWPRRCNSKLVTATARFDIHLSRREQCLERTECTWTHTYHGQSNAWNGPSAPGHTLITDRAMLGTDQCTWTHNSHRQGSAWNGPSVTEHIIFTNRVALGTVHLTWYIWHTVRHETQMQWKPMLMRTQVTQGLHMAPVFTISK